MRLCIACLGIFSGHLHLQECRPHHSSVKAVHAASAQGCYICSAISKDLQADLEQDGGQSFEWYLGPVKGLPDGWLKLSIEMIAPDEAANASDADSDEDVASDEDADAESLDDSIPELLCWGWILQKKEDVAHCVGDYQPPRDFSDSALFELARSWYDRCKDHTHCNRDRGARFVPTRLLDLSKADIGYLTLRDDLDRPMYERYATLSHCWGSSQALKLTSRNLHELQGGVVVSDLPASWREAITVSSGFGIRYLWIDSLCIMQDSKDDWLFEASRMGDVYKHSDLNIAASGASENSQHCFSDRSAQAIRPPLIEAKWKGQPDESYFIINEDLRAAEVDYSPLRRRAWVLQEVSLAPRVLNFGKTQMWWECFEFEACETYPNGIPHAYMANEQSMRRRFSGKDSYTRYEELVEMYSACALTFDTDRIVAFAGIAQHCQSSLEDEYISGMFRSVLVRQLLWRVHETLPRAYRPAQWRAPSWSWLSIEGTVVFDYATNLVKETGEVEVMADVVKTDLRQRKPESPSGSIPIGILLADSKIHLAGPVVDLHFRPHVSACESIGIDSGHDGRSDSSITLPEDELEGLRQFFFGWDEAYVDSTENRFRFIAMTKYRQDDVLMLHGLLLRPSGEEEHSQEYERVGQLQVRGAELVELFLPSQKREVCIR